MGGEGHEETTTSFRRRWPAMLLGFGPYVALLAVIPAPAWGGLDRVPQVVLFTVLVGTVPVAALAAWATWLRNRLLLPRIRTLVSLAQALWSALSAYAAFSLNDFAIGSSTSKAVGLAAGCAAALTVGVAWAAEDRASR